METERIIHQSATVSSDLRVSSVYDVLYLEESTITPSSRVWTCMSHKLNTTLVKLYYSFQSNVYCFHIQIDSSNDATIKVIGCKGAHVHFESSSSQSQTHMDTFGKVETHAMRCLECMFTSKTIELQLHQSGCKYEYPDCDEWILY